VEPSQQEIGCEAAMEIHVRIFLLLLMSVAVGDATSVDR
jgi:hypothetical protein